MSEVTQIVNKTGQKKHKTDIYYIGDSSKKVNLKPKRKRI